MKNCHLSSDSPDCSVFSMKRQMGVLPSRVPPPPSLLRQIAYQEHSPLCGPEIDPEGWEVLDPVTFEGTLFNVQPFKMSCRVSILSRMTTNYSPVAYSAVPS